MSQPRTMKKWLIRSLLVLAVTALVFPLGAIFSHAAIYRNKIYPGVKVADIDVGGLTQGAAETRLRQRITRPDVFKLNYAEDNWEIDFADLEPKLRAAKSVDTAFLVGRDQGFFQNLGTRYSTWSEGTTLPISWSMKTAKSRPVVEQAALAIDRPAVDAVLLVNGENVRIEKGQTGRKTKVEKTIKEIRSSLLMNEDHTEIAVKEWDPAKTTERIKALKIEARLSEFTTKLSTVRNNRRHNIALATGKINDYYVEPGAVFSFNEVVGSRTSGNGFMNAPVISGGNLVPGIGGGICQVATTLYNAAMETGLPVVERSLHSNYIGSYPDGRDATVVDGVIDLKFRNDTGGHLLLRGEVRDADVVFWVYGPKTGRKVTFSAPSIYNYTGFATKVETDTALPPGARVRKQAGVSGRTITVTRKVTKSGKTLIDEETTSRYLPRQELIMVGPAPPPPEPEPEPEPESDLQTSETTGTTGG